MNSTSLQNKLLDENDEYQDLIQGNFMDTYRNLTYKHVMSLKWFKDYCPNAKFLFRTDDDALISIQSVYGFMEMELKNIKKLLVCRKVENAPVYRGDQKWRVSKKEYADDFYPSYCYGYAIIYTRDVVNRIYREAQRTPFLWVDDVFVTGILVKKLRDVGINPFHEYFYHDKLKFTDLLTGKLRLSDIKPRFIFIQPDLSAAKLRKLWNIVKDRFP